MDMNNDVLIPVPEGKVYMHKHKNGTTYVRYEVDRVYHPEKKYNVPKFVSIGKLSKEDDTKMQPNRNYFEFFPDIEVPEQRVGRVRSSCLKIGSYFVVRKIAESYGLPAMLESILGPERVGLFLDLACYCIICENNAAQYYPDYAYNHPLFTDNFRIYSDAKISQFLTEIGRDESISFLNAWNQNRDVSEHIYITYDSSDKKCQAGQIEMVEMGHGKRGVEEPIFNSSLAYDVNNREPLFYENYLGSIVDVSQLECMLSKARSYGYENVGFILDRGYFSYRNISYMDEHHFDFLIMVKGNRAMVEQIVSEPKGCFEESRKHSIRQHKVSGMTIRRPFFYRDEQDGKERYIHIYYSPQKAAKEREELESKLDAIAKKLEEQKGQEGLIDPSVAKYFELVYHQADDEEIPTFMGAYEKNDAIDEAIKKCGYFAIISSAQMDAEQALDLYRSRDYSEKLFRADKTYLGNSTLRVHSQEAADTKLFIAFVALIIRNKMYTLLKDEMLKNDKKSNFMTVPAAIRELEKIEIIRHPDGRYRLDHAITANQKAILKAFNLTESKVKRSAIDIADKLMAAEA